MTILKPEIDTKEYKLVTLENRLRALIISDPMTDKASAALDVHIGHLQDPTEFPGLAHFCEHLLFMGTEKYPQENDYAAYLSSHSGHSNAYTAAEHTNYYFDISSEYLEGALDRFAQFFICPLFNASCTEREIEAVDSEHKKNVHNDEWRLHQLSKDVCMQGHPYTKFGTGNKQTLTNANIRQILLDFHAKYYSANLMTLVILGKESLDILHDWLVTKFSSIINKNVELSPFTHPLQPKKWISVKSIKDWKYLELTFALPDQSENYKFGASRYLSHLIGHEGQGSILALLKKRGWALELSAGLVHGGKGFDFFRISIDLTMDGFQHSHDIVVIVFQYILLLQNNGIQEWIFKECQALGDISFRFREKEAPSRYTSKLATQMHLYEPSDILSGPFVFVEFSPRLIQEILNYLTLDHCRVFLVAPEFELMDASISPYYGTEYKEQEFSHDLVQKLNALTSHSELHLPKQNDYLPSNFSIKASSKQESIPSIIHDSEKIRFWHLKDNHFNVPKANAWLQLKFPMAYTSPRHAACTDMFCELVKDQLNDTLYYAQCAGLGFSIDSNVNGILLQFHGYQDKMLALVLDVLGHILSPSFDKKRIPIIKEYVEREYKNFAQESPYFHAMYHLNQLLQEKMWTLEEKLESLKSVQDLDFAIPQLFIEGFVHGNYTREDAMEWTVELKKLCASFDALPLVQRFPSNRTVTLLSGQRFIYQKPVANTSDVNSAVAFYLQTGSVDNLKHRAFIQLLHQLSSEAIFDQLRTKEQLGYIVFSGVKMQTGWIGLRIIVQGEKEASYLEHRIQAFLDDFKEKLNQMSMQEFEDHKNALVAKLLEKPKNLSQESNRHWNRIHSGYYDFDQQREDAECIKQFKKEDIQEHYMECIHGKKASVHLKSAKALETTTPPVNDILIQDLNSFKLTMELSAGVPLKFLFQKSHL